MFKYDPVYRLRSKAKNSVTANACTVCLTEQPGVTFSKLKIGCQNYLSSKTSHELFDNLAICYGMSSCFITYLVNCTLRYNAQNCQYQQFCPF